MGEGGGQQPGADTILLWGSKTRGTSWMGCMQSSPLQLQVNHQSLLATVNSSKCQEVSRGWQCGHVQWRLPQGKALTPLSVFSITCPVMDGMSQVGH